jgi:hypothetical protein
VQAPSAGPAVNYSICEAENDLADKPYGCEIAGEAAQE